MEKGNKTGELRNHICHAGVRWKSPDDESDRPVVQRLIHGRAEEEEETAVDNRYIGDYQWTER